MSLNGNLEDLPLLDILQIVSFSKKTGYLSIRTEGLEDDAHEFPNGHSHCRAALIGVASQSIPIVDGNLLLGRYQSVFFCELDRAKPRKVFIQVMGE